MTPGLCLEVEMLNAYSAHDKKFDTRYRNYFDW